MKNLGCTSKNEYLFKLKLIYVLLFCLNTTLLGQISHSTSFSSSNLTFSIETAKDGVDYEKVTFEGLQQTDEIGKPNLLGREVNTLVEKWQPEGEYKLNWEANYLNSSIYFYRLKTEELIETRKLILVK